MDPAIPPGLWEAHLESPGGPLRFGLAIDAAGSASLLNGEEVIPVGPIRSQAGVVTVELPPYESQLKLTLVTPERLEGAWRGRRDEASFSELRFHARLGSAEQTGVPEPRFGGRWAVQFQADAFPAVGVFEVDAVGESRGTFMTALGDFRFLAGRSLDGVLELSCFDGSHAFLFRARLIDAETLEGEFWSGQNWHETWTAKRDPEATPPDPFALNRWRPEISLANLSYTDAESRRERSLDEVLGEGPTLLYLYGSWCPNCTESARVVEALHVRFAERSLQVVGLAFEFASEIDAAIASVKAGQRVTGATFPVLIAGPADKSQASRAFPALDQVLSYPTFVVLDRKRRARAVCTGFSGAATKRDGERFLGRLTEALEAVL